MGRSLLQMTSVKDLAPEFRKALKGKESSNKTLFSVIEDQGVLLKAVEALDVVTGNIEAGKGEGIYFFIPIRGAKGLKRD